MTRPFLLAGILLTAGALCLAGKVGVVSPAAASSGLSPEATLGKDIFFDKSLSASGTMACATCHNPRFAYGPPNGLPVQFGGPDRKSPGFRAVPSLRYTLKYVPVWSHVQELNPLEKYTEPEEVPAGGYGWDGAFNSPHAQAMLPLFSPEEMDSGSVKDLARKLSHAAFADEFRAVFGKHIFDHPTLAVKQATMDLQQFEFQDKSFHPYTSKYDEWLDGKATLTAQELRGKKLFDDPEGGNCSSCHLDQVGANGAHPIFTDFQFEALGVPRNMEIPWNKNPKYYDLGICGPFRKDAASKDPANCGLFRTPTLRNVATRHVFFHNGEFHTLREALEFYVQRDTDPKKWYPVGPNGKVEKFNDLPPQYRNNVDTVDLPFGQKPGDKPIWNAQQIDDVIAFLKTLTDQDAATTPGPAH